MKNLKSIGLASLFVLSSFYGFSQFEIVGQYKARAEFANGYQKPLLEQEKASFYIAQRARFGANYIHEKFKFKFSVQDIRTWGNTSNIMIDDKGYLSIYEANVSLFLTNKWSIQLGRQPIAYDNDRIFGSLDWAMQARRHDAAIVQFKNKKWNVDIGAAYNNLKNSPNYTIYELNNYKTFQYVWAKRKGKNLDLSFLVLNNGMERIYFQDSIKRSDILFSQTLGTHIIYRQPKFNLTSYGYYQAGIDQSNHTINAYNLALEGAYYPNKQWKFTLGGEILSGTSQTATSNYTNRSFSPLYGTNHKFNGFMDYFYVGNHENSVGLIDGYLKGHLSNEKNKFTFGLANHIFFAEAPIFTQKNTPEATTMDPFLGYEIDFTVKYQFTDEVEIELGYSQFFDTSTLRELKGAHKKSLNNWVYLMITVNPFENLKLFQ